MRCECATQERLNPLKRWEASVAVTDRTIQQRTLDAVLDKVRRKHYPNLDKELCGLFHDWMVSGWSDEALQLLRFHIRHRTSGHAPVDNFLNLMKKHHKEIIKARKSRGECTWMLEDRGDCVCGGTKVTCRRSDEDEM